MPEQRTLIRRTVRLPAKLHVAIWLTQTDVHHPFWAENVRSAILDTSVWGEYYVRLENIRFARVLLFIIWKISLFSPTSLCSDYPPPSFTKSVIFDFRTFRPQFTCCHMLVYGDRIDTFGKNGKLRHSVQLYGDPLAGSRTYVSIATKPPYMNLGYKLNVRSELRYKCRSLNY
jgi:hypothetical protein